MTRLVIVAPNWLGDAVMALPAIADVRRALPGATIAVAARPSVASLFAMASDVDEVVVQASHVGRARSGPAGTSPSFDVAVLFPNSFRSALDARRAGIPERWGYRTDARGLLLTRAVPRAPAGTHQVESYRHLVHALGFPNGPGEPRLEVKAEDRDAGRRALTQAGWDGASPLVVLAPGAAFGGAKRWPPGSFADLARELGRDGVRPVLVGSAADEPTKREIEGALGPDWTTIVNLVGKTNLPTLAGVLAHARGLVANDSGAVHLGAAIGVPVTTIFGPTDERTNAPRSTAPTAVLAHPVWCRPCWLRECPLDHRCMRGISVSAVAAATRRML